MTRLDAATYLSHLTADTRRFRDVLATCDPTARVPACPDWNAGDLLWHLAEVQSHWAWVIEQRPAAPDDYSPPERRAERAALLELLDRAHARLTGALRSADPAEAAWSWSEDRTVGFTLRRQAHEALIHRLDAEETAGLPSPCDPALAADGVAEVFEVMYGGLPAWATFAPQEYVRVLLTDTGHELALAIGRFTGTSPGSGTTYDEDAVERVASIPSDPGAVVSATAADLDTWLWKRGDAHLHARVQITGDADTIARFRACVAAPIE